jgi:hypothetical protein
MATNVNGNGVILLPPELGNYPYVGCNCFWIWDGSNWNQAGLPASFNGRGGYAIAYDATHNQVILFGGALGGLGVSVLFNDTWVWNGSNWTQSFPSVSPPARGGHGMAYDAARGQLVLFGGNNSTSATAALLNDTWTWNGTSWQQMFPSTSPPPRSLPTMAADSIRSEVLLFGGYTGSLPYLFLYDTWTWNGSNWAQQAYGPSPTWGYPAMEYDAAHGQVVLLNRTCCFGVYGDVWSATWTWGAKVN